MTSNKAQKYRDVADKCRQLAADASCPDAREYYEALSRDYVKLANAEAGGARNG